MGRLLLTAVLAFCLGMMCASAHAEDGSDASPPPPKPPPPGGFPPPTATEADAPDVVPESVPEYVGTPVPAPAPPFDSSADAGTTIRARDGRCRCRLRRFRVTLEGLATALPSPEEVFGEEAYTGDQMTWDTIDYPISLGGRIVLDWRACNSPRSRWQIAVAHWGEWDDSGDTSGTFGYLPPIPGFITQNSATLSSTATMFGAELNWFTTLCDTGCTETEFGLGARYLQFNEEARADNFGTSFDPGFPTTPFVESDVENTFIGVQFLGRTHFDLSSKFRASLGLDLMLGNLNRDVSVKDSSIFAGGSHSSSSNEDQLVFGFEFEASMRWCLSPCFSIVGGYRMLFLDDVVRGNDAMGFDRSFSGAVQARQETDQLFAHSLFLGVSIER